jgi:hypothetical protein
MKLFMTKLVAGVVVACITQFSMADSRPDFHAPIGVMGDHKHAQGEWMFSYRYMRMTMDQNLSGTDEVSVADVLGSYIVSPVDMDMGMHMLGLMYAPSDRLTLMAMTNFVDLSMNHRIRDMVAMNNGISNSFTTKSDGIGDTTISGIYELASDAQASWLLNAGLSIPTGSIDNKGNIPLVNGASSNDQLPFPMQTGSGTYDLLTGITYTKLLADTSWGAQLKATVRLGENDNGYTKGNEYQAQAWHAWLVSDHVSLSTRLSYKKWEDYDGQDNQQALPIFNGMMGAFTVPTVDPGLRGGSQTDIAIGTNTVWGAAGHRLAAELVYPLRSDLDGPQLGVRDAYFVFGYQLAF